MVAVHLDPVLALSGLVALVLPLGASTTTDTHVSLVTPEFRLLLPPRVAASGVAKMEPPAGRGKTHLRMEERQGRALLYARKRGAGASPPMARAAARLSSCRREPPYCLSVSDVEGCTAQRQRLRGTCAAPHIFRDGPCSLGWSVMDVPVVISPLFVLLLCADHLL